MVDQKDAEHADIWLCQFSMSKDAASTIYSLQLTNGQECWAVARRYSEFLRCHTQLLELFGQTSLPPIPPKEPLLQKIFGRDDKRVGWAEERKLSLQLYLSQLLKHRDAMQTLILLTFLNAPAARISQVTGDQESRNSCGSEACAVADTVLISGIRVRLTKEPGGIEVIVSANAVGPCCVRLALRPLEGEAANSSDLQNPTLDPLIEPWERWLELDLPGGSAGSASCEAAHCFTLQPGSLWQIGAVGVNAAGKTGNVVRFQITAPTEEEASHAAPVQGRRTIANTSQSSDQRSTSAGHLGAISGQHVRSAEDSTRCSELLETDADTKADKGYTEAHDVEQSSMTPMNPPATSPSASSTDCAVPMNSMPANPPTSERSCISGLDGFWQRMGGRFSEYWIRCGCSNPQTCKRCSL